MEWEVGQRVAFIETCYGKKCNYSMTALGQTGKTIPHAIR